MHEIAVLDSLDQSRRDAAAVLLQNRLAPCISGNVVISDNLNELGSRVGGVALLPTDLQHPCDRTGKPMHFVAQINFADLPDDQINRANHGLFLLFWNAARDYSNPKDRHAFRCIWLPQPEENKFVFSQFSDATIGDGANMKFSPAWSLPEHESAWQIEGGQHELVEDLTTAINSDRVMQLFGKSGKHFDRLQEIAAFAGNGISWSAARRGDSCFSHLVESANQWKLLLKISSVPEVGFDLSGMSMYLLIRDDDLAQHNYDKAWLIVS